MFIIEKRKGKRQVLTQGIQIRGNNNKEYRYTLYRYITCYFDYAKGITDTYKSFSILDAMTKYNKLVKLYL